jgi:hypothetical protein
MVQVAKEMTREKQKNKNKLRDQVREFFNTDQDEEQKHPTRKVTSDEGTVDLHLFRHMISAELEAKIQKYILTAKNINLAL